MPALPALLERRRLLAYRRLVSGPALPEPRTPGLTIVPRAWEETLRPVIDRLDG